MREICKSGSMRGMWKRGYGWLLRHRQTKGTATAMQNLLLPRHIPTLPRLCGNEGIFSTGRNNSSLYESEYFVIIARRGTLNEAIH